MGTRTGSGSLEPAMRSKYPERAGWNVDGPTPDETGHGPRDTGSPADARPMVVHRCHASPANRYANSVPPTAWCCQPGVGGRGALAQLVERLHGMQEVRGSNPLSSTLFRVLVRYKKRQSSDNGAG